MGRKKERKPYPHEDLIASFSKRSISAWATFHPQIWDSGKEPADMIVKVGRALLFVNMQKSSNWFEQLCEHNIGQARDRILEWKAGRQLRGKNEHRRFVIDYKDVDTIVVISVIDGPHARCAFHPLAQQGLDEKVRLCFSLTSPVLDFLSSHRGGARDLVRFGFALRGLAPISSEEGVDLLRQQFIQELEVRDILAARPEIITRLIGGASSFQYVLDTLFSMRMHPDDVVDRFAELGWSHLGAAASFANNAFADIESLKHGACIIKEFGDGPKFAVIVTTTMQGFNNVYADRRDYFLTMNFWICIHASSPMGLRTISAATPGVDLNYTRDLLISGSAANA
jgi:hypothetical protein